MALLRRKRKRPGDSGMSPVVAGLIAIVLIVVGSYFGFTKANPFANPYELTAVFENASSLKPGSPVRIAGVDAGIVKKVETFDAKTGAAKVSMELEKTALPIHEDAELKIRPRILLEGNFFVDVKPGSPNAPILAEGEGPIPMAQTAAPVQLGEILTLLKADVRGDLRTLLAEYSLKGLEGGGAEGFNDAIEFFEPAYRSSSLANDAFLGVEPDADVQRVLRGQQGTAEALTVDEEDLKDLVTNLNVTAGAIAAEDDALRTAIPALRDTLRVASPALASLNSALPPLRAFSREALPGVRSSDETIDASLPFIRQTRGLVRPDELQGAAAVLRRRIPSIVRLNSSLIPFLREGRELGSCTNEVLVPFLESAIPSGEEGNTGQLVREQIQRAFVGLSGESRASDANGPWFRTQGVAPAKLAAGEVQPVPPTDVTTPPPHRPDVPCETQEPPNLNAPEGMTTDFDSSEGAGPSVEALTSGLRRYMRSDRYERVQKSALRRAGRR
jgi:ABC-type transporter Mla subunit MlaD